MLGVFRSVIYRIQRSLLSPKKDTSSKNYSKGPGSIDSGITVTVRENVKFTHQEPMPLKIGNDSIVGGNFVFERPGGRITIGDRTFIGGGDFICICAIEIGNDVLISWGCTLMDNNAHALDFEVRRNDVEEWKKGLNDNRIGYYKNWDGVAARPIIVKDKAWIGFKSIILKGVTIGEGAVVGSGSVVTKDVEDWTVVAGNPAVVIRKLK